MFDLTLLLRFRTGFSVGGNTTTHQIFLLGPCTHF